MSIYKRALLIGSAVLGLTSCASTFNPYKLGQNAKIYEPVCKLNLTSSPVCVPLDDALSRAKDLQATYLEAAGRDELVRKVTGSGITLATTYALILGISDKIAPANASDQIIALGGGVASANAITSIFTNPTRQRVFIAGASAMTCVRQAATPFELDNPSLVKLNTYLAPTSSSGSLEHSIRIVDTFIEELSRISAAATAAANASGRAADIAAAADLESYVSGIKQEISAARTALGRGYRTFQEVTRTAPARLLGQLGAIDAAVATQLQQTTVDLNAIQQITANLKASAANIAPQFSPVPSTPSNSTVMAAFGAGGTFGILGMAAVPALSINLSGRILSSPDYFKALSEMRDGTSFINLRSDDIERRIKSVGQSFETCNFEPVDLGIRLQTDKIEINQGQSGSFVVEEGQAPFVAKFAVSVPNLSVEFTPAFGNRGVVTVGAAVAKDDYQVSVYDRTMKPVTLTVTVK